ncbi:hypothetical protein CDV36_013150 [Fusarium kuroshium]|uniref:Uncharacterized protein n=3 Tax=Fusarium solani species complex TaxID=232080 RepID=A0A3M2RPP8_9HYPO|nr:hypothetical protein CDV36_013150 [Fusarium kuroshium]RSL78276.1 hypothetical protein CEP51_008342 [Fusarium floridanum]RSM04405.1 hypothetical protein CDV31_010040 [Fusarium ambrosium]
MPLLHKTAASLLSCIPKQSRPQKSHSAAAVKHQDDPKSTSSSRSSSPNPTPPEEIELDVLTSKPAPPSTRSSLDSTLSNSTTSSSSEESSTSESSCNKGFFTDSSGLTPEERRKLVEEILKELEA